jgi:hypothetical protein
MIITRSLFGETETKVRILFSKWTSNFLMEGGKFIDIRIKVEIKPSRISYVCFIAYSKPVNFM